ncbi:MAG: DHH family phosphoesterase [Candidatus Nomurabacteria bacterium]|nr:MAG: DHH family phosphoesterase [Candidatus Nomurabacteria bacterium]HRV76108.1 DHH family phosphoesterase [Candidatus Saccharimonadales bacterium]
MNSFKSYIEGSEHILVIQAENPDGDSVASSLALESLILDNYPNKKVTMFCNMTVPAHLRYLKGYDRVSQDFPRDFDLAIVVDCAEEVLLSKTLQQPESGKLKKLPVLILDHHNDVINLPFETVNFIDETAVSTGSVVFNLAKENKLEVSEDTATFITASILSDTMGLTLDFVKADDFRVIAELIDLGANVSKIDQARRELNKRPQFITQYKGELLQRVEYLLDGRLAYVHIPWEEIEKYSGIYNPPILVFEDMRLTEGVQVVMAVKTYKNGKMTAKIRTNPGYEVAGAVAEKFNCGGHPGSAGCKVEPGMYTYDEFKAELIKYTREELDKLNESDNLNKS